MVCEICKNKNWSSCREAGIGFVVDVVMGERNGRAFVRSEPCRCQCHVFDQSLSRSHKSERLK